MSVGCRSRGLRSGQPVAGGVVVGMLAKAEAMKRAATERLGVAPERLSRADGPQVRA